MILQDADSFYSEMSELIKTERIKKNIKQEKFCERLSLTRASVINLEKGRHRPSIYQLLLIANILNVDYTQLIPVQRSIKNQTQKKSAKLPQKIISDQVDISESAKEGIENFLSDLNIQKNDIKGSS